MKRAATNNYKSWPVALGIWAQAAGIPGASASASWMTKRFPRIASTYHPNLVEKFIREYNIDYAQATRCSADDSPRTCALKYGTLDTFFARRIRNIHIDPTLLVSPATSKATVFDVFTTSKIWVKGKLWSAARLLGQPTETLYDYAVGLFRLRPQDYHRFHSPFRGVVTNVRHIGGGYLSVDPQVVHSRNVFTENNRVVFTIESSVYGTCHVVAVGAAGIGRVKPTVGIGKPVVEGDELGTFSFGGSTIIVLIPVTTYPIWRTDLAGASLKSQETYVQVGENVGI